MFKVNLNKAWKTRRADISPDIFLVAMILISFFCRCGSGRKVQKPMTIDITHQSVYLKPIMGLDVLRSSSFWPQERSVENVLLDYVRQVWKELLIEFRRCEKYGLYSMIDSTGTPTVIVTVKVVSSRIRNDSLIIPLEIKTVNKSNKKSYTLTVDACGSVKGNSSEKADAAYYLGAVFADYKRNFPYKKVVSSFYEQGN